VLIRKGDAQQGQLPIKPWNFLVPLLEGCLRPLDYDTLPLKEALGLFSCQVLALEGGSSLSKCGPLLLELSLCLLARVSLLPKLLLRRGEGGGLVRQGGPQLLGLLSLPLGLALPSTRSLEGRVVLLELGTSRGHLRLPLRRHGPRPAKSSRVFRSASSRSRSAVLTFAMAEASSAARASCSRSSSRMASI
jgi:hypothetical protein